MPLRESRFPFGFCFWNCNTVWGMEFYSVPQRISTSGVPIFVVAHKVLIITAVIEARGNCCHVVARYLTDLTDGIEHMNHCGEMISYVRLGTVNAGLEYHLASHMAPLHLLPSLSNRDTSLFARDIVTCATVQWLNLMHCFTWDL